VNGSSSLPFARRRGPCSWCLLDAHPGLASRRQRRRAAGLAGLPHVVQVLLTTLLHAVTSAHAQPQLAAGERETQLMQRRLLAVLQPLLLRGSREVRTTPPLGFAAKCYPPYRENAML